MYKRKNVSLLVIIVMLVTMLINTSVMSYAEEGKGFEGNSEELQEYILQHANAESQLSRSYFANLDEWNKAKEGKESSYGEYFAVDENEDGIVSTEEADMAWIMEMFEFDTAYLITLETVYEIKLVTGEGSSSSDIPVEIDSSINQDDNIEAEIEEIYNRAIEKYPQIEVMNREDAFIIIEESLNYGDEEQIIENLNQLTQNENSTSGEFQELELSNNQEFINIQEELEKHLDLLSKAYINESFRGYRHLAYPTVQSEVQSDKWLEYANSYSPDFLVPKEEYQRAPSLDVVLKSYPIENYKNIDFTGLVDVNKQVANREKIDQLGNEDMIETVISIDENNDVQKVIVDIVDNDTTNPNTKFNIDSDSESNISKASNVIDNPIINAIEKVIENEKAKQEQLEDIISILDEVKATDEKPVRVDKLNEAMREIDEMQNSSSNIEVINNAVDSLNDNDMFEQAEELHSILTKDDSVKLDEIVFLISEILDADSNENVISIQEDIKSIIEESKEDIKKLEGLNNEVVIAFNPIENDMNNESLSGDSEGSTSVEINADGANVENNNEENQELYRWKLSIPIIGAVLLVAALVLGGIAIIKTKK